MQANVALAALLAYELPAATTMRDFLEGVHVEDPQLLRVGAKAAMPDAIREWAEVPYVADDGNYRKHRLCVRRYLAL